MQERKSARPAQLPTNRGTHANNRPQYATMHQYTGRKQPRQAAGLSTDFKAGLILGLAIGVGILAAVMVFWAVPTVDGAVRTAQMMASTGVQA